MPIIGWLCSNCSRQVPLDHFATTKCGEAIHPDYAAALLADRASQEDRVGVRVSHGLSCPRRAAIEAAEDYYVDPLSMNAALTGTAWHEMMESAGASKCFDPDRSVEAEVAGTIAGINLTGRIDRLRGDLIEDWKHKNDFDKRHRDIGGADPEHVTQLSLYAELAEQSGLRRPSRAIVWYHYSVNSGLVPKPVDLMSISEALEVKPYGGSFAVHQLLRQADSAFNSTPLSPDLNYGPVSWNLLPLAGSTMSFGSKSMCSYCSVESICMTAERGAPF